MERGLQVPKNVGIVGSAQNHVELCEGSGFELLRLGSDISARILSAKMERVLRNITIFPPQGPRLEVQ